MSTVGKQLREARRQALEAKSSEKAREMKADVAKKVEEVIIPKCLEASKKNSEAKSVSIYNGALGWDYLMFKPKGTNDLMRELELRCAEHDLSVTYIIDYAVNHLDIDSVEGIEVHWDK